MDRWREYYSELLNVELQTDNEEGENKGDTEGKIERQKNGDVIVIKIVKVSSLDETRKRSFLRW